jgi:beta-glucosidase-like glycosyl hydrolase
VNYQGYSGVKAVCMGNVMVSYSAINDISMSINGVAITGILKQGIYDGKKFEGFFRL